MTAHLFSRLSGLQHLLQHLRARRSRGHDLPVGHCRQYSRFIRRFDSRIRTVPWKRGTVRQRRRQRQGGGNEEHRSKQRVFHVDGVVFDSCDKRDIDRMLSWTLQVTANLCKHTPNSHFYPKADARHRARHADPTPLVHPPRLHRHTHADTARQARFPMDTMTCKDLISEGKTKHANGQRKHIIGHPLRTTALHWSAG